MVCTPTRLPGGGVAIVCSTTRRRRCACGKPATLQCDWKVKTRRSGTCDRYVCEDCATRPAPDKDLCREHGEAFKAWQGARIGQPRAL